VREVGAGVVHLQWELFLYGGSAALAGLAPAMIRFRRAPSPLVVTMHQVLDPAGIDRRATSLHRVSAPPVVARAGIAAVQRTIAGAADATIVHEHAFRRVIPGARVVPHGVEQSRPVDRHVARRRLGLDDRFVALCFGYLAPYKGLELAAQAALATGSGVSVVIAGAEHPRMAGADSYGSRLRARYGDAVDFRGWVPDGDVPAWFSSADVALFPYPKPFSASGALALALAHRTPVLMSPAMARCIGAPSLLVAPMRPDELARRLASLATDPADLAGIRAATAGLAEDRRWSTVARHHADLYADVYADLCEEVHHGSSPVARTMRAG
jgi:glycosyltransferase involved in cell wall biosynthesis